MNAGVYRHYKGGFYQLIGIAEHTETKEPLVVYIALDPTKPGPRIRCRPQHGPEGWETPVPAYPGAVSEMQLRFKWIGASVV